jgi:hypothetical protein
MLNKLNEGQKRKVNVNLRAKDKNLNMSWKEDNNVQNGMMWNLHDMFMINIVIYNNIMTLFKAFVTITNNTIHLKWMFNAIWILYIIFHFFFL